jgi:5-methyltetrahydropteroyltriglutamate--homocysteine methyltransferase
MPVSQSIFNKPLPVIGVGSYATPGWLFPFKSAMRDGRVGEADIAEAFDDATRIAIADQVEAGVDIISDGELRRQRFVYEMYDRVQGIERQKVTRRLGVPGYDMAPAFIAHGRLTAEGGLGLVDEFRDLQRLAPEGVTLKMALPGPLTFASNIYPGDYYGGPKGLPALMADIIAMVNTEARALIEAGVEILQLDEPGLPKPPEGVTIAEGVDFINEALIGLEATTAVHVCFGNNASRPFVRRDFARLMPGMGDLKTDILMLEFANREMADLEYLKDLSTHYYIAAGVVDVKNFHLESAEEVAERIKLVLGHMPAEKLLITSDCGFSAIPRWLARVKMQAMVAGADQVRNTV